MQSSREINGLVSYGSNLERSILLFIGRRAQKGILVWRRDVACIDASRKAPLELLTLFPIGHRPCSPGVSPAYVLGNYLLTIMPEFPADRDPRLVVNGLLRHGQFL